MNIKKKLEVKIPTKTLTIQISEDTERAIQYYIRASMDLYNQGGATSKELEEVRSYAADAITGLMMDNPDIWDYVKQLEESHEAWMGRGSGK